MASVPLKPQPGDPGLAALWPLLVAVPDLGSVDVDIASPEEGGGLVVTHYYPNSFPLLRTLLESAKGLTFVSTTDGKEGARRITGDRLVRSALDRGSVVSKTLLPSATSRCGGAVVAFDAQGIPRLWASVYAVRPVEPWSWKDGGKDGVVDLAAFLAQLHGDGVVHGAVQPDRVVSLKGRATLIGYEDAARPPSDQTDGARKDVAGLFEIARPVLTADEAAVFGRAAPYGAEAVLVALTQPPTVPVTGHTGHTGHTSLTGLTGLSGLTSTKSHADIAAHFDALLAGSAPLNLEIDDEIADFKKVYVLGDLEGQLHLVYGWFVDRGLITQGEGGEVKWTGEPGVYVVQCGDQIDSGDRQGGVRVELADRTQLGPGTGTETDLSVMLFLDFLQAISGGRVISLIGNHEWLNVRGNVSYVSRYNASSGREAMFRFDGLLGRVLRRRKFVQRIGDLLFSHAGVTQAVAAEFPVGATFGGGRRGRRGSMGPGVLTGVGVGVGGPKGGPKVGPKVADVSRLLATINAFARNPACYSSGNLPVDFERLVMNGRTGVIWNRAFSQNSFVPQFPAALAGAGVRAMITGHNHGVSGAMNFHDYDTGGDEWIPCNTGVNRKVAEGGHVLVMTDTASQRNGARLDFLTVSVSEVGADYSFDFGTYRCGVGGMVCPLFNGRAILMNLLRSR